MDEAWNSHQCNRPLDGASDEEVCWGYYFFPHTLHPTPDTRHPPQRG
ncbi:MAG: hypothetical protein RM022_033130 [Nostoc sp. EfeVER01]